MSDPRFARLKTDPRFRRPKKHHSKVVVDERFKGIFQEDGVGKTKPKQKGKRKENLGRVDKFGRQISETHEKDNLRRFYQLENEGEEAGPLSSSLVRDYARGGVLMESSESEAESQGTGASDDESDANGFVTLGRNLDEEGEIDLDESTFADLDAQAVAYSRTVPSEDDGKEVADKTRRLAIVNLDWDHVRAAHLYKIFSSLVSPAVALQAPGSTQPEDGRFVKNRNSSKMAVARGKVLSVRVYPSEFGKDRIAREEKEGPPVELFKQKKIENEEDINKQTIHETGGGADYDEDALRKYQLERLRYYYGIVECDTVETAMHIYSELEGTELERSANVFDLSFVPDGMVFDEECRDEATDDPGTRYRAVDFVTDALRHSKVKLTWDNDDPERNHITRRPLTKKEIEEADFRAYIASSSSESDGDANPALKMDGRKNVQRDKLRTLLLGGDDDELPEGWGRDDEPGKHDDVDMEITFMPGLVEAKKEDETTMEMYQRKMKEKRKKRKEEAKLKTTAVASIEGGEQSVKKVSFDDDFFEGASGSGSGSEVELEPETQPELKKRGTDNPAPRQETNSSIKAEKRRKKRKGKKKADDEDEDVQDEFVIDVKDVRFKAIHEDHQFAIDPSHPHFKKTKNMVALLDERVKRQRRRDPEGENNARFVSRSVNDTSLKNLVESVKRKSAAAGQGALGKRRKL